MIGKKEQIAILEGVIVTTSHYREASKCRQQRRVDDYISRCRRCDAEDWLAAIERGTA